MGWAFFGIRCLYIGILTGIVVLGLGSRARAQCYCTKAPPPDRFCGELLALNDNAIVLLRRGHKLTLDRLEYAACPSPAPVSTPAATPSPEQPQAPTPVPTPNQTEALSPKQSQPKVALPRSQGQCKILTQSEQFAIVGSNTVGERLMPGLIAAYARKHGCQVEGAHCGGPIRITGNGHALTIHCSAHGTGTAIPALEAGTADIGQMSRPVNANEKARMAALGFKEMDAPPHEKAIALDGLLVMVSNANPVNALSLDQIARVFAGEITDWSRLGGPRGRINVYARDRKSGTRDTFDSLVMEPRGKQVAPSAQLFESSSELAGNVARDPNSIGFVGFAYGGNAKALAIRELCGITHEPSVFEVKTEDYPLARRLFLYTARLRSRHADRLSYFALSEDAQPVITATGYINNGIEATDAFRMQRRFSAYRRSPPQEAGLDTDAAAMRELASDARRARRLSTTFRFRTDSARLDTKAWQDVRNLADYLVNRDRQARILLLGFADSQGSWAYNKTLSQQRADEVKRQLLSANGDLDPQRLIAKGYSELMPASCNGDAGGRAKNRRVEVWLMGG